MSEPPAGKLGAPMQLMAAGAARCRHPAPLRRRPRRPPPERRRLGEVPRRRGRRRRRRRLGPGPRARQRARRRRHDGDAGGRRERPERRCRARIWSQRCAASPAPRRPMRSPPRSAPGRHRRCSRAALPRDAAEVILSGLSYSHRAGTARTACEQVFDARRCRDIDWLAGKTGTPSFPSDGLSLDELARLCRERRRRAAAEAGAAPAARCGRTSGTSPPYRADGAAAGPWTKAIAVLTERNWLQRERPDPRRRRPRAESRRPRSRCRSPAARSARSRGRAMSPRGGMAARSGRGARVDRAAAMRRSTTRCRARRRGEPRRDARRALPAPLVWTFDGPFERCLADLDDTLRRALVLVGDVVAGRAADRPLAAGAAAACRGRRPRCSRPGAASSNASPRYGLPAEPRVRHLRAAGPLATLVVAYRS